MIFDSNIRTQAQTLLDSVFSEFSESVVVYKAPSVIYAADPSSYSPFFQEQNNSEASYVVNSGVFNCRVESVNQQDNNKKPFNPPENPVNNWEGVVRVTSTGQEFKDYAYNAEKIVWQGLPYKIISDIVPHGLFGGERQYFTLWMNRID